MVSASPAEDELAWSEVRRHLLQAEARKPGEVPTKWSPDEKLAMAQRYVTLLSRELRRPLTVGRLHLLLTWLIESALLPSIKAKVSLQWGVTPYLNPTFWQALREWTVLFLSVHLEDRPALTALPPSVQLPHLLPLLSFALKQAGSAEGYDLSSYIEHVMSVWEVFLPASALFTPPSWEQHMLTAPLLLSTANKDDRWQRLVGPYLAYWQHTLSITVPEPQKRHFVDVAQKLLPDLARLAVPSAKDAIVTFTATILFAESFLSEWHGYLLREMPKVTAISAIAEKKEKVAAKSDKVAVPLSFPRLFFETVHALGDHPIASNLWCPLFERFLQQREKAGLRKESSASQFAECAFAFELIGERQDVTGLLCAMRTFRVYHAASDAAGRWIAEKLQRLLERLLMSSEPSFDAIRAILQLDIHAAETPHLPKLLVYLNADAPKRDLLLAILAHFAQRHRLPELLNAFLEVAAEVKLPEHFDDHLRSAYASQGPEEQARLLTTLSTLALPDSTDQQLAERHGLSLYLLRLVLNTPVSTALNVVQQDTMLLSLLQHKHISVQHHAFARLLFLHHVTQERHLMQGLEVLPAPLPICDDEPLIALANQVWYEQRSLFGFASSFDEETKTGPTFFSRWLSVPDAWQKVCVSQLCRGVPIEAATLLTPAMYDALAQHCLLHPDLFKQIYAQLPQTTARGLLLYLPATFLEQQSMLEKVWEAAHLNLADGSGSSLLTHIISTASLDFVKRVQRVPHWQSVFSVAHQPVMFDYAKVVVVALPRCGSKTLRPFVEWCFTAASFDFVKNCIEHGVFDLLPAHALSLLQASHVRVFFDTMLQPRLSGKVQTSPETLIALLVLYARMGSCRSSAALIAQEEESVDDDEDMEVDHDAETEEDDAEMEEDVASIQEEEDEMMEEGRDLAFSDGDMPAIKALLETKGAMALLPLLALDRDAWADSIPLYLMRWVQAASDMDSLVRLGDLLSEYIRLARWSSEMADRFLALVQQDEQTRRLALLALLRGSKANTLRHMQTLTTSLKAAFAANEDMSWDAVYLELGTINAFLDRKTLHMTMELANLFLAALYRHQYLARTDRISLPDSCSSTRWAEALIVTRLDFVTICCLGRPTLASQWMVFLLAILQDLMHLFRIDGEAPLPRTTPGHSRATAMVDGTGGDPLLSLVATTVDLHVAFRTNLDSAQRMRAALPFAFERAIQFLTRSATAKSVAKPCTILLHEYIIIQSSTRPFRAEIKESLTRAMYHVLDHVDTHALDHMKVVMGSLKEGHPVAQRAVLQQLLDVWEETWRYKGKA